MVCILSVDVQKAGRYRLGMFSPMAVAGFLFIPAFFVSIAARGSALSRLLWSVIGLLVLLWLFGALFPTWPHDLFGW